MVMKCKNTRDIRNVNKVLVYIIVEFQGQGKLCHNKVWDIQSIICPSDKNIHLTELKQNRYLIRNFMIIKIKTNIYLSGEVFFWNHLLFDWKFLSWKFQ